MSDLCSERNKSVIKASQMVPGTTVDVVQTCSCITKNLNFLKGIKLRENTSPFKNCYLLAAASCKLWSQGHLLHLAGSSLTY